MDNYEKEDLGTVASVRETQMWLEILFSENLGSSKHSSLGTWSRCRKQISELSNSMTTQYTLIGCCNQSCDWFKPIKVYQRLKSKVPHTNLLPTLNFGFWNKKTKFENFNLSAGLRPQTICIGSYLVIIHLYHSHSPFLVIMFIDADKKEEKFDWQPSSFKCRHGLCRHSTCQIQE